MRISFCDFSIELTPLDSKSELEEVLRRHTGPKDLLQEPHGHGAMHYTLRFRPEMFSNETTGRLIGLSANKTGIKPELLLAPKQGLVYVGIGVSLFVLDPSKGLKNQIDLGSPFYWMTSLDEPGRILVVSEITVFCLTPLGEIIWRHDTDIISSVERSSPRTIKVSLMENGSTELDLVTGRRLNKT